MFMGIPTHLLHFANLHIAPSDIKQTGHYLINWVDVSCLPCSQVFPKFLFMSVT